MFIKSSKNALEESDKSSKSSKKKKTKTSVFDQQSKNSSADEKTDCENKRTYK